MERVLTHLGDYPLTLGDLLVAGACLIAVLLLILLVASIRGGRRQAEEADEAIRRSGELERHLAHMLQVQSELTGRVQMMSEAMGSQAAELRRTVNDRLDSHGQRIGQAMQEANSKTTDSLGKLQERLAVIDAAQSNITKLSEDVVGLQAILANKQTRGAFGQGRMEAIIGDGLAPNAYAFQFTLTNGSRPDAVVFMPNGAPPLVIDAKFPLESWQRLNEGQSAEETKHAATGFRNDMGVHVKAISEKYLIAGETQDTAFLFVPSESIFADLHERFEDVVQKAVKARVVIVSPSILMLSIQVVQALLRDVRMREEAHKIQREVTELLLDVGRLTERTRKLQAHFQQANNDVGDILTSAQKLSRRGERIEAMDFEDKPDLTRLAGE